MGADKHARRVPRDSLPSVRHDASLPYSSLEHRELTFHSAQRTQWIGAKPACGHDLKTLRTRIFDDEASRRPNTSRTSSRPLDGARSSPRARRHRSSASTSRATSSKRRQPLAKPRQSTVRSRTSPGSSVGQNTTPVSAVCRCCCSRSSRDGLGALGNDNEQASLPRGSLRSLVGAVGKGMPSFAGANLGELPDLKRLDPAKALALTR